MRLSDVRHQERSVSILRRALGSGRTHHAYLFDGPEGVGKELAARALAARLLCEDQTLAPDADACGQCPACHLMASDNHPDFHLIHRGLHKLHPDRAIRAAKGLYLVVDLIRHFLIQPAGMKPTMGRRRVFLVRDAQRMNEQAQNALLKTLEEPPGSACLILVTSSAARLLPTIRSRCQRIPFDLLPPDFVTDELTARLGLSRADGQVLARLADGRLGVALRWHRIGLLSALDTIGERLDSLSASDPESFGKALVETATGLATRSMEAYGQAAAADSEEQGGTRNPAARTVPTDELRDALKLVLLLIAALHRDALVVRTGAEALRNVPAQQRRVDHLAAENPLDHLDACLNAVSDAERMLDRNVAPQLACEHLAVALMGELPVL